MRVQVPSGPGALGRVGQSIELLRGTIASLDFQSIDEHATVIDCVINLPQENANPQTVGAVLRSKAAGELKSWRRVDEAIDPVLRAIRWACSISSAGTFADDELMRVIREICDTTDTVLMGVEESTNFEPVRRAFETCESVTVAVDDVPPGFVTSFCGEAWVLAVPDAKLEPSQVAVVVRPLEQPFSATETKRVEAVLALRRRAAMLAASGAPAAEWPPAKGSGPWLDLSSV